MKRVIVTGFPRGGTGYTSEVLRASGIVAGYEKVFNPANLFTYTDRRKGLDKLLALCWPPDLQVEVSWLALPFVEQLTSQGHQVVFQTRDPWKVMESLCRNRFLDSALSAPYREYALSFLGPEAKEVIGGSYPLSVRYAAFVVRWWCLSGWQGKTVRVESAAYDLFEALYYTGFGYERDKVAEALEKTPRNTNTKDRGGDASLVTPEQLKADHEELYTLVQDMRGKMGYQGGQG